MKVCIGAVGAAIYAFERVPVEGTATEYGQAVVLVKAEDFLAPLIIPGNSLTICQASNCERVDFLWLLNPSQFVRAKRYHLMVA